MAGRYWTNHEAREVLRMMFSGIRYKDISAVTGRSVASIKIFVHRNRV